ncbi:MAG TPA: pilus assembly protein PilM [Candidatus Paceibacterota bacterium]|jgi:type IV pilus assembly protein PilM|nr:pilus assembly protein PilM [Candidatus Paceibacterota bacterium]
MASRSKTPSHFKNLQSVFPPPRFLLMSRIGVDISNGFLRHVRFEDSLKGIKLASWGQKSTSRFDPDDISDSDRDDLKKKVIALKGELGTNTVRVVIPDDEVYLFRITIPYTEGEDLRSAVEFKLEENLPIAPADTLFEYDVISTNQAGTITLSVSAVSRAFVSKTLEFFQSCGLDPIRADTEARCLARSLSRQTAEDVELIVSISGFTTSFIIARSGKPLFSSNTPIGSKDIGQAIAKSFSLSEVEAEKMRKQNLSTPYTDNVEFLNGILPVMASLKDEINKVIVYWNTHGETHEGLGPVSRVILTGEDAALSGVVRYIGSGVSVPVVLGDVWTNILSFKEYIPKITKDESLSYGAVVGICF